MISASVPEPPGRDARQAAIIQAVVRRDDVVVALRSGQFVLHYQPIVSLRTGQVTGVEALVRWRQPDGATLFPDAFLPAIAHTPVMRDMTRWVLHSACSDVQRWPDWSVSVNVAARDVTDPALVGDVAEAIAAHHLDPGRVTLELTEHAVLSDLAIATGVLGQLRGLGVGLSLDDFGTGYSSLLYLRELPLTEVKVDRTFVADLTTRAENAAIVEAVIRLADTVGLHVVAEGVESVAQAEHLHQLGCGWGQGYLWGRPSAAADVDAQRVPRWHPTTAATGRPAGQQRPAPSDPVLARRIQMLLEDGASLHTIAAALNREDLRTAHGTRWSATSVATAITALPPARPEPPG